MDDPDEIHRLYNNSLYAAYLAGTSIVWNHVDLKSPRVAALCEDLQGSRCKPEQEHERRTYSYKSLKLDRAFFPHAYANAYLTPPKSQTVPPHADDRDVLVFQLVGRKRWRVYQQIPIHYPFTHEQVGKSGIAVPESVLKGPLAFDDSLQPGDVLYIPRGMVHEAKTDTGNDDVPELSFHITVALATYDWTLVGNLSRMLQTKLMNIGELLPSSTDASSSARTSNTTLSPMNLRRSILPTTRENFRRKHRDEGKGDDCKSVTDANGAASPARLDCGGFLVDTGAIQKGIDSVFKKLRTEITAESVAEAMDHRIKAHNLRASGKRNALIMIGEKDESQCEPKKKAIADPMDLVVGPVAAKNVSLETHIRSSTPIERDYAQKKSSASSSSAAGLNVRDEIGDDVAEIVTKIKIQQPQQNSTFRVGDFHKLLEAYSHSLVCKLTSLSLAKRAVELGAFAVCDWDGTEVPRATKRRKIDVNI
ncbi:unnamed protein product [Pseudo-nitzschia multistriata]|uniref:Bifunctional lysine-specific demethylase and histidyl-hydroxylase n=1 Tax=Pseudo-nitzschia multistriata TaxID=183589 RepID=A0A448ZBI0_9STRA|nr:unnamed protein product [Pseudo-nitzschia multistriata]